MKNQLASAKIITLFLLVAAFTAAGGSRSAALGNGDLIAAIGGPGHSLILFKGALYSPGQAPPEAEAIRTFTVLIDGTTEKIFVVETARNQSGVETELQILKSIFPRHLFFWGDKELLAFLQSPQSLEKTLLIQGHLYRAARRFQVLRVEIPGVQEDAAESGPEETS